jgi:hypothetical protein
MIISIDSGKEKKSLPYSQEYNKWRKHLSDKEYNRIVGELYQMIDKDEIHTSGWMPGSNWMGTVFEPIYHACGGNETQAALFFGLIVYKVFMDRPDAWACGRFQLNGKDIKSLTYFRVNI